MRACRNRLSGFSLLEVLVVIGIIMILMGILLATVEHARHQAYIADCATHLRSIGQAMMMYASENHGEYPRTVYVPGAAPVAGTGVASANPFGPGGPAPNDVTAAVFLLMRVQKLPTQTLICAYNDVNHFEPDRGDVLSRSNFTDYRKNLGYSFANPYPDAAAAMKGYRLTNRVGSEFAIAADLNPGTRPPRDDVTAPSINSPASLQKKALSENHEKGGENVLYGDGHVQWQHTSFCGRSADNIFTNHNGQVEATPMDKDDSVLLPVN
jgi:prepilin-type processing-associated H-X9-DG protein